MNSNDETSIPATGVFEALGYLGGVLALRFWVFPAVPWPELWLEDGTRWVLNILLLVVSVAVAFELVKYGLAVHRRRRAEEAAAETRTLEERQARRGLREQVRTFAAYLDSEYGWLLAMPAILQKERALAWYDTIVATWREENHKFAQIVGNDDYPNVVADLGAIIPRMIAIWQARVRVYQYALAWSDEVERAAELLRVQRQIQQLKVRELKEQQKFDDALNRALAPSAATADSAIDDSPRPTRQVRQLRAAKRKERKEAS